VIGVHHRRAGDLGDDQGTPRGRFVEARILQSLGVDDVDEMLAPDDYPTSPTSRNSTCRSSAVRPIRLRASDFSTPACVRVYWLVPF
jgi:hypothetical protein